jgi:hypothetical protein
MDTTPSIRPSGSHRTRRDLGTPLFAQVDTLEIGGDGDVAVALRVRCEYRTIAEEGGVAAHVQTGLVLRPPPSNSALKPVETY